MPGMTMRMNVRRTTSPFSPLVYSPALWLDASDASTLVMDGAVLISVNNLCLKCPDSPIFRADGQIWVAFWAKFAYTNNPRIPYIKGDATAAATYEHGFVVETTTNNARLSISNGSSSKVAYTATNPTLNNWHFYFGYIDPANNIAKASLDGGTFGTVNLTGFTPSVGSNDFVVGAGNPTGTNHRVDYIDSFAVGKPSSAGWLASNAAALASYLYNSGSGRRSSDFMSSPYYTGGNPSGAGSWYDMDERSGNRVDRIGSNNLTPAGSAAASIGYAAGVASGLVQYTGDPVKQWSDKSGNARHLIAPSDAARPTYTTGAQNGLPALTFDGVNDYLTNTDVASIVNGTGKSLTAFVVVKTGTIDKVAWGFGRSVISSTPMLLCYPYAAGSRANLTHRTDTNNETNVNTAASSTATNTTYIITAKLNATTAYVSVNGGTFASGAITQSAVTLDKLTVGAFDRFGGVSGYLNGVIAELAMYGSELDSVQITNMLRYLGNKWGITVA